MPTGLDEAVGGAHGVVQVWCGDAVAAAPQDGSGHVHGARPTEEQGHAGVEEQRAGDFRRERGGQTPSGARPEHDHLGVLGKVVALYLQHVPSLSGRRAYGV